MANQTANRLFEFKAAKDTLRFMNYFTVASGSGDFYRGQALGINLATSAGGTAGYAAVTMDGTYPVKFMGVVGPYGLGANAKGAGESGAQLYEYSVPVMTGAIVEFVASGATQSWVGKPVWFTDNQTVALKPTANKRYPVWAGHVVEYKSTTAVLVDISAATEHNRPWQSLMIGPIPATGNILTTLRELLQKQMQYDAFIGFLHWNTLSTCSNLVSAHLKIYGSTGLLASNTVLSAVLKTASGMATYYVGDNLSTNNSGNPLDLRVVLSAKTAAAKGLFSLTLDYLPMN